MKFLTTSLLFLSTVLLGTTTEIAPTLAQTAPIKTQTARIQWNNATLTLVQEGGSYGRLTHLKNGEIFAVYERAGRVHCRRSADTGKTWQVETEIARFEAGNAANPEILQLLNGDLLCSFNPRPRGGTEPFAISTTRSGDNGQTWSAPQTIYTADTKAENGCWEPIALQKPNGDIHLFFANENPYRTSPEQEITRLISRDNGQTWSAGQAVSFRPNHRDGMPVPIRLQNGQTVMAIEDNGLNGDFKPVIVNITDNKLPVGVDEARRWSALQTPLSPRQYAGAPYLRQMPTGHTILSAQWAPDGQQPEAQMAVWVGDANARNFVPQALPFAFLNEAHGLWNSLFVKDARTITAVSGTRINGVWGLWTIDGSVIP